MPSSLGEHAVGKNIQCETLTTESLETNNLLVNGNTITSTVSAAMVQSDFDVTLFPAAIPKYCDSFS